MSSNESEPRSCRILTNDNNPPFKQIPVGCLDCSPQDYIADGVQSREEKRKQKHNKKRGKNRWKKPIQKPGGNILENLPRKIEKITKKMREMEQDQKDTEAELKTMKEDTEAELKTLKKEQKYLLKVIRCCSCNDLESVSSRVNQPMDVANSSVDKKHDNRKNQLKDVTGSSVDEKHDNLKNRLMDVDDSKSNDEITPETRETTKYGPFGILGPMIRIISVTIREIFKELSN